MLDVMRKHSRSFIIYIFFGIIIAVFVVNFGPQSAGCTTSTTHAARVQGELISLPLFNAITVETLQRSLSGLRELREAQMVQFRSIVMDQILVRELLADDASEMGFRISDKEIDDMLVKGRYLSLGQAHPLRRGDDGKFDYDLFAREVRYTWNIPVPKFKAMQRRELLAEKFRQYLRTMVKVSEDEVHADFLIKNTQTDLSYVRFSPADYRSKVELEPAKVRAFLTAQKKRIAKYYQENKAAFQKLPKQVKLQQIQLRFADDAAKGPARQRAEGALQRLKGGESFARVAASLSEDPETRAAGGLLGWRNEDSPAIDPAAAKVVPGLKQGQTSAIIEGKKSFVLLQVLGRRQGNLGLAQAEDEIAEDLFRSDESLRLAKQEAAAFIKRARGGERLEAIFTTGEEPPQDPPASQEAAKKDKPAAQPTRSPLRLSSTSFFSRSGEHEVPGIGISQELMRDAFKLKKDEVATKPYVVGQMIYLVACKERKEADLADWQKRKDDLVEEFVIQKWSRQVREYAHERCEEAIKNKRISVNDKALLTPGYVPNKKDGPLPSFAPCSSLESKASL